MRRVIMAFVGVSQLVPIASLSAQEPPLIEPGTRVRVTAPDCGFDQLTGTLEPSRGDTLALGAADCPLGSVTRLDMHRGKKSNVATGALFGAVVGVLFGGIAGSGIAERSNTDSDDLLSYAALGAAEGTLVGAIVGALFKTDRWEKVPLDRPSVSFAARRDGGFALGLTLSF